jgi:hypothetical protein
LPAGTPVLNIAKLLIFWSMTNPSQDGILGHQFNKRLESFAPYYSQSLLLADLEENNIFLWFLKSLQSEIRKFEFIYE